MNTTDAGLDLLPFHSIDERNLKNELKPVRSISVLRIQSMLKDDMWDSKHICYNHSYVYLQRERRQKMHLYRPYFKDLSAIIETLPLDVFYNILTYLHPLDLYHLSKTSKNLRSIVSPDQCGWLWKEVYDRNPGIPQLPSDMCPLHWTHHLFAPPICEDKSVCGGLGIPLMRFTIFEMLCHSCYMSRYFPLGKSLNCESRGDERRLIQEIRLIHDRMDHRSPPPSSWDQMVDDYFSGYPTKLVKVTLQPSTDAIKWHNKNKLMMGMIERSQFTHIGQQYWKYRLQKRGITERTFSTDFARLLGLLLERYKMEPDMKIGRFRPPRRVWPILWNFIKPNVDSILELRAVEYESFRRYIIERIFSNVWSTHTRNPSGSDKGWSLLGFFPFIHRRPYVDKRMKDEVDAYGQDQGYYGPPRTAAARQQFFSFISSVMQKYKVSKMFIENPTSAACVFQCESCSRIVGKPVLLFGWKDIVSHDHCAGKSVGPFLSSRRAEEAVLAVESRLDEWDKKKTQEKGWDALDARLECWACEDIHEEEWPDFQWKEYALHHVQMESDPKHRTPKVGYPEESCNGGFISFD